MPPFRAARVRVRVPATSANLGPGFDSAGLALTLYDDVTVALDEAGLRVEVRGEGADEVPRDEQHLIVTCLRVAFERLGAHPPGLTLSCVNRIPHARGLGSSSAAICAAILAARALVVDGDERLDDAAVLSLASELEGHPDNVAACLRGGVTFAWGSPVQVLELAAHPDLAPVAFVPPTQSSTREVRGLLPSVVPFPDAVSNAARAALLPTALSTTPSLLLVATEDRLHQQYRAPAMPATAECVRALRADGVAAVVSGAGPSVLALVRAGEVRSVARRVPAGWRAFALGVDEVGATVTTER